MNQAPSGLRAPLWVRLAAAVSVVVSLAVLAIKFWAASLTQSQAVFSDAMESIVNVASSVVGLITVVYARRPADRSHPYGHGKAEYFSAAFEGGLVSFAAAIIGVEAVRALLEQRPLQAFEGGIALVLAAGLLNVALGVYLLAAGRRSQSAALSASGVHVLTDVATTVASLAALGFVGMTGLLWIDGAIALITGAVLIWTGWRLVARSAGGLMDSKDFGLLAKLVERIESVREPGIIQVHHARIMRSGSFHHIDAHVVMPEFWNISEAHERGERFEQAILTGYPSDGELHLHIDPCRRAYCTRCDLLSCPIRASEFLGRPPASLEELTRPDEPL
jgi:cation diffusion facilitator family transporter